MTMILHQTPHRTRFRTICLALLCLLAVATGPAQAQTANIGRDRVFTGAIGDNYPVTMRLSRQGVRISGEYKYDKVGHWLRLRGELKEDGSLTLMEYDSENKNTGVFTGRFTDENTFAGTWQAPFAKQGKPFLVTAKDPSPAPTDQGAEAITMDQVERFELVLRRQIHPTLPEFAFTLAGTGDPAGDRAHVTGIIIGEIGEGPFQEIENLYTDTPFSPEHGLFEGPTPGFVVEDMNFDGYADIRLMEFMPEVMNTSYLYWLYNPEKVLFERRLDMETLSAPVFDAERKEIVSSSVNPNGPLIEIYVFRENDLVKERTVKGKQ